MFKTLWLKLAGVFAAISGVLLLMLKRESSKRAAAEQEAKTEKANRELLQKHDRIVSEIDEGREDWTKEQTEEAIYNAQYIESLKHETDDRTVITNLVGVLNKNNRKD